MYMIHEMYMIDEYKVTIYTDETECVNLSNALLRWSRIFELTSAAGSAVHQDVTHVSAQ